MVQFTMCKAVKHKIHRFIQWKLHQTQNTAVRIIKFSAYNAQTSLLLKQLRLPGIQDLIQQETAGMVYKANYNQASEYLSVMFHRVSAMTGRTIRNANINQRSPAIKHHPWSKLFCTKRGLALEYLADSNKICIFL